LRVTQRVGSSEAQAAVWNATAAGRARWIGQALVPLWQTMLDVVRLPPGARLLDAGCGSGEALALALARSARVWGLDCSETMLAAAREAAPGATLVRGDLEALPFPDRAFDAITACNSVHFAADPRGALRELARVARPGARIAITSMGSRDDLHVRRVIFEPAFAQIAGPPPVNPFIFSEPGALEGLLASAGLSIATTIKVLSEWTFADFDEAWAAWRCVGPVNEVMKQVGEARVRAAVHEAAERLAREGGAYVLRDWWRVVIATAA
jgi:SAM-dependent methyltransferase